MSIFGLGSSSAEVEIALNGEDERKQVSFMAYDKADRKENAPLYLDGESVTLKE